MIQFYPKLGVWESCNTYAALAFEGMYGVSKDLKFGLKLAEQACLVGHEPRACYNLEQIYTDGLLGEVKDGMKAMEFGSKYRKVMDERDQFLMNNIPS